MKRPRLLSLTPESAGHSAGNLDSRRATLSDVSPAANE